MGAMTRGTTPTLTFNLPFDTSAIQACEVYFSQDDKVKVVKYMEDCKLSGTTLQVSLTQAETLMFNPEAKMETQIRFLFEGGTVDATNIITLNVGRILKGGEIRGN